MNKKTKHTNNYDVNSLLSVIDILSHRTFCKSHCILSSYPFHSLSLSLMLWIRCCYIQVYCGIAQNCQIRCSFHIQHNRATTLSSVHSTPILQLTQHTNWLSELVRFRPCLHYFNRRNGLFDWHSGFRCPAPRTDWHLVKSLFLLLLLFALSHTLPVSLSHSLSLYFITLLGKSRALCAYSNGEHIPSTRRILGLRADWHRRLHWLWWMLSDLFENLL